MFIINFDYYYNQNCAVTRCKLHNLAQILLFYKYKLTGLSHSEKYELICTNLW